MTGLHLRAILPQGPVQEDHEMHGTWGRGRGRCGAPPRHPSGFDQQNPDDLGMMSIVMVFEMIMADNGRWWGMILHDAWLCLININIWYQMMMNDGWWWSISLSYGSSGECLDLHIIWALHSWCWIQSSGTPDSPGKALAVMNWNNLHSDNYFRKTFVICNYVRSFFCDQWIGTNDAYYFMISYIWDAYSLCDAGCANSTTCR